MSLRYHNVKPSNQQASYQPFDNIDFEIDFPNRKIVGNSFRIVGLATVVKSTSPPEPLDPTTADKTADVAFDNMAGAHSFFSEMSVSTSKSGNLQNLQHYPRYVKMKTESTFAANDMFTTRHQCELKSPDVVMSRNMLSGARAYNSDSAVVPDIASAPCGMPFSIQPDICLNNMIQATRNGDANISYSQTGTIRVGTKISQVYDALWGPTVESLKNSGNPISLSLSDLYITYKTIPDDGKVSPKIMKAVASIKQSITSSSQELNVRVPAIADGVSCSFVRSDKLASAGHNELQTEAIPNLTLVEFGFNGSNSQFLTYQLKDRSEMLKRYLESFGGSSKNDLSALYSNNGYGVGLNFYDQVDLSKDVLNVRLESAQNNPMMSMFLYFHSTITM